MTCAACSGRVQRSLEKSPGVRSANVNLMTGAATVEFDPAATSPDRLVETIRGTGYGAELPSIERTADDLLATQDQARAEEIHDLRRKFAVSMVVAALTMILGMPLAALTSHGRTTDPLMRAMMPLNDFLTRVFPGIRGVSGDTWRWLLLGLTLPVVGWAGRHFYTRAWAAFRHHGADMNTLIAVGTGAAFVYSTAVTLLRRLVRRARHRAARLLRGGRLDHRARAARQPARGPAPRGGPRAPSGGSSGSGPPPRACSATARRSKSRSSGLRPGDEVGGPPGRDHPRRRGRARRHELRGRVDADRRAGAGAPRRRATRSSAPRSTGTARSAFRVERTGADTVLSRIIRLVQQAQGSKAPIQRLADRISAVFVPVVFSIAIAHLRGLVRCRAPSPPTCTRWCPRSPC